MGALGRGLFVKETVTSCVEVPRLNRIGKSQFVEGKRLSEIYENQIEEKSKQLKGDLIPTSYKASIEDENLTTFVPAGWVECSSID